MVPSSIFRTVYNLLFFFVISSTWSVVTASSPHPKELSWISGEEFGVYNWDYRIDVTVVPKESSYSNPDEQVRILKSQEPSLLAERIRQAAVRD